MEEERALLHRGIKETRDQTWWKNARVAQFLHKLTLLINF